MTDPKRPDVVQQPPVDARSRIADVGLTKPAMQYDYTNFYFGAGEDPFDLLEPFDQWWGEVEPEGYYQYELPLMSAPKTRVDVLDKKTGEVRRDLINFASYNYLGLSYRPEVKQAIKDALDIYGGGSSGSPIQKSRPSGLATCSSIASRARVEAARSSSSPLSCRTCSAQRRREAASGPSRASRAGSTFRERSSSRLR